MIDKSSIDTNILIYAYLNDDLDLKKRAIEILNQEELYISHFAFCEFLHYLKVCAKKDKKDLLKFGNELLMEIPLNINSRDTYLYAYNLLIKYDFQFPDSIIIADAILNNCKIFYSRDMQHNQLIDKKLRIINPFIK